MKKEQIEEFAECHILIKIIYFKKGSIRMKRMKVTIHFNLNAHEIDRNVQQGNHLEIIKAFKLRF